MVNIGVLTKDHAQNNGLTGVLLRSTGYHNDIRLNIGETYASYYYIKFNSYIGFNGDTYDRYLIRMNEIVESLNIVSTICNYFIKKNENDYNEFYKFFDKK